MINDKNIYSKEAFADTVLTEQDALFDSEAAIAETKTSGERVKSIHDEFAEALNSNQHDVDTYLDSLGI